MAGDAGGQLKESYIFIRTQTAVLYLQYIGVGRCFIVREPNLFLVESAT